MGGTRKAFRGTLGFVIGFPDVKGLTQKYLVSCNTSCDKSCGFVVENVKNDMENTKILSALKFSWRRGLSEREDKEAGAQFRFSVGVAVTTVSGGGAQHWGGKEKRAKHTKILRITLVLITSSNS